MGINRITPQQARLILIYRKSNKIQDTPIDRCYEIQEALQALPQIERDFQTLSLYRQRTRPSPGITDRSQTQQRTL